MATRTVKLPATRRVIGAWLRINVQLVFVIARDLAGVGRWLWRLAYRHRNRLTSWSFAAGVFGLLGVCLAVLAWLCWQVPGLAETLAYLCTAIVGVVSVMGIRKIVRDWRGLS